MRLPYQTLLLLGLGLAVFFIFLTMIGIDPALLTQQLSSADPLWAVLAVVFDVFYMLSYGVAWYFLVKVVQQRAKLRQCVTAVLISIFGDISIPTGSVTGEALRIAYAKKKLMLDVSKALVTTFAHRLLNSVSSILVISISVVVLYFTAVSHIAGILQLLVLLLVFAGTMTALGFFLLLRRSSSNKLFTFIVKGLNRITFGRMGKFEARLNETLESYNSALALMLSRKANVGASFTFLMLQWMCGIMVPYAFFQSLRIEVNFWVVALAYPIYGIITLMPVGIPAMAGVLDAWMVSTFVLLGVDAKNAVPVTILTRLVIVVFEVIVTGGVTLLSGARSFIPSLRPAHSAPLGPSLTKILSRGLLMGKTQRVRRASPTHKSQKEPLLHAFQRRQYSLDAWTQARVSV